MGGSTSKPDDDSNTNPLSMEIVLDKGVKQQIDKLSEYVSIFNSNDVKPLLQVIKDYKMNLETSTGRSYDLNNIDKFVTKFHKELLDKITKDYPTLSDQEKQIKVSEKLKDKGLSQYLSSIYDDKIVDWKEDILKNPIVKKDAQMSSSIQNLFSDITGLKSKYRYFEYRYIQLNLFLMVFIQHTYFTMDKFINTVLAYTVNRDKDREDSVRELINLLLRIMKEAELNIDQKDFETIDQLMSVVEKQVKDKQLKLGDAVEQARVGALDEMLQIVMANHDVFSQQTVDDFGDSQHTIRNSNRQKTPFEKEGFDEEFRQDDIDNSRGSFRQYGGFVKDHSTFPQAFYEL